MSVFVYKLGHDNCVLGEANYLNGANHEATQIRDKNLNADSKLKFFLAFPPGGPLSNDSNFGTQH